MSGVEGRHALVVGLRSSGSAAARVLIAAGARVRVSEARDDVEGLAELQALGVEVFTGGHEHSHLDGVDLVVASPGVFEAAPILVWAQNRSIPIWSELELGARLCSAPYAAVTGTNGKTTTTEMLASVMRASGMDAIACGNIGHPFSLAAGEGHDALAVEASSFQLRFHESFHPRVSVLLNLAEDHLDWHGSYEAYADAKSRIFAQQSGGDVHIGNADDSEAVAISREAPCRTLWFRLGEPGESEVGYVDGRLVARIDREIAIGRLASTNAGFLADAAAATAAALSFGVAGDAVAAGILAAKPLPHRGQVVAMMGEVAFVDDSKATNPHAALAGLEGRTDVVLIAGGMSKGVDLSPLVSASPHLKGVVAIGEAASEIVGLFEGAIPVRKADSMQEAVETAFELADHYGTVMLAPACASQDMFIDYRDRGERFTRAAVSLSEDEARG